MGEVILRRKLIEMNYSSSSSTIMADLVQLPSTKSERKIIEKNRRNQMKFLFSTLNSLIPKNTSKEALPLPDQIDEAISYIKNLEAKLKKSKEKKESLASKKRPFSIFCTNHNSEPKAPQIEIREMGFSLEIILVTGLENKFIFHEIIGILREENADIVSASSSVAGNSVLHVVHSEMSETESRFGTARVKERLDKFRNGSTSEIELEVEPESCDYSDFNPNYGRFE